MFSRAARFLALWIVLGQLFASVAWATGGAYSRIEASFDLGNLTTDPFNFLATNVKVDIRQPDCTTVTLPAFFDGGVTWRVRHTPTMPGLYTISAIRLNGSVIQVANLQPDHWWVTGPPANAGFVRLDPTSAWHFMTDDGRRFFPVGENVGWNPSISNDYARIFSRMGVARENWSRVWMDHFYEGKNLDWPKVNNTFGKLNLQVARRWDFIVQAAEQAGIHFQMVLQHHGQYSSTVNPNWDQNPYNAANGGFLTNAAQFFTDSTAKALTKRKLRYIISRWGYSPAIMTWELFNEVQYTDAARSGEWAAVAAWHEEMAAFIRSQDPYHHLITNSSDLSQPIWDAMDYYQYHNYASDTVTSSRDGQAPPAGSPVRPIFAGECTPHDSASPPGLWVEAPIWASLMAAQSGAGCPWWWDTIDPERDYPIFRSLSDFVALSGLADQDVLTRTAPAVTGGALGPLAFSPGGGWTTASQDTFTVGSSAPDGIGSAPGYLQGNYHRQMTPNGYTFLVNYPQAGIFSVQVLTIAASGASLRISLDGVAQTNIAFAATGSDVSTNFTTTIPVPAGAHTIHLDNPGLDWVLLGNLTLDPYVSALGAYAVGNSQFSAAWIWHRANLFHTGASTAANGIVELAGLDAGTYSATWWDTDQGVAITNFSLTVAASNSPVALTTPDILRSAALFIGHSPQARLSTPSLVQSLGTNSPSFSMPLVLTNSGGLPLAYSLSVTGATPVTYTAVNSLESGGPQYNWKDISGSGLDITTNFIALTGSKDARDEGVAGPIDMGFAFPFFSGGQTPGVFRQLYVSPNGFITFTPFTGDRSGNTALPNSSAPANLIAFLWDDLDASTGQGRVYVASDPLAGEFTVQFQDVRFKDSGLMVTAQMILRSTGEILLQYNAIGRTNSCTIGVQDAAATNGLQITFNNASYLRNGMAVRLTPTPWFTLPKPAGIVPPGTTETIYANFDPGTLPSGDYSATLLVETGDPAHSEWTLPVSLAISSNLPAAPLQLTVVNSSWSSVRLQWIDNSSNEGGFEVRRKTGSDGAYAIVGETEPDMVSFIDSSVGASATYYYQVRATNSFGTSPWSEPVCAVTPASPIDIWRQANFGTTNNAGDAADLADPDHDGWVNLLEYAFGQNPNVANPRPWSFAFTNAHLMVRFTRPHPAPADISYQTEVTADVALGSWQKGAPFTSESVTDNGDGTETVVVTDLSEPLTNAAHFLGLRVTRP